MPRPGTFLNVESVLYGSQSSTRTLLSKFMRIVLHRMQGPEVRINMVPTRSSKKRSSAKGSGQSRTMFGLNCSVEQKKLSKPSGCLYCILLRSVSTEALLMIWNAESVQKVLRKSSLRSKIKRFGLPLVLRLSGERIAMTSFSMAAENHSQTVSLNWNPK